jgi:type III secretion protein S
MDQENVLQLTTQAMLLCLTVSLPPVIVSAIVGLLISFFQAITSLQEQSISQAAKLIAVVITIIIAAPWGGGAVLRFAETLLRVAVSS